MLVSIIMPYFKKKKYVKYSVLSVLNQTFKNFELIIVYDNETNDELKFINKIKKLDKRIKVIKNKFNIGAGLSRNVGIDNSKGAYLAFLDADDLIEHNTFTNLYKIINETNCDLVFSDRKWNENSINIRENKFIYDENKYFNKKEIIDALKNRYYDPLYSVGLFQLTGRLIKRSIIIKNNLFFEEKLRYLEDEAFEWDLLGLINNAIYVKKQLYTYTYGNIYDKMTKINKRKRKRIKERSPLQLC